MEAIEHVEIRARVGGFITSVNFEPGAIVKKGDVLFVIDPRPYEAEAAPHRSGRRRRPRQGRPGQDRTDPRRKTVRRKSHRPARATMKTASGFKELDASARAAEAQFENGQAEPELHPRHGAHRRPRQQGRNHARQPDRSDHRADLGGLRRQHLRQLRRRRRHLPARRRRTPTRAQPVVVHVGLANETGYPARRQARIRRQPARPANRRRAHARRLRQHRQGARARPVRARAARRRQRQRAGARPGARCINERAVGTDQNRKFVYVVGADGKAEYRAVTLGPTIATACASCATA